MARKSMMWMSAAMLALGIGLFSANTASAGWGVNINLGNRGYRSSNYGFQNRGFRSNRGYSGFSNWRGGYNRGGHGHYHSPVIRRGGNNFGFNPGYPSYGRGGRFCR